MVEVGGSSPLASTKLKTPCVGVFCFIARIWARTLVRASVSAALMRSIKTLSRPLKNKRTLRMLVFLYVKFSKKISHTIKKGKPVFFYLIPLTIDENKSIIKIEPRKFE